MWKVNWTSEAGGILIHALIIVTFIGVMITTYGLVMRENKRSVVIHYNQRQAAYTALGGVEYAIKRILKSKFTTKTEWQESLYLDDNSWVRVRAEIFPSGWVTVESTGMEHSAIFKLKAQFSLISLRGYGVIARGPVSGVEVKLSGQRHHPWHMAILASADVLPIFELPENTGDSSDHVDDDEEDETDQAPDEGDDDTKEHSHNHKRHLRNYSPSWNNMINGQRLKRKKLFAGPLPSSSIIVAQSLEFIVPPTGKARRQPYLFYLPPSMAQVQINYSQPVDLWGVLIVNGPIMQGRPLHHRQGKIRLHVTPGIIENFYRKYSVNEAPYIIRNLQIYPI